MKDPPSVKHWNPEQTLFPPQMIREALGHASQTLCVGHTQALDRKQGWDPAALAVSLSWWVNGHHPFPVAKQHLEGAGPAARRGHLPPRGETRFPPAGGATGVGLPWVLLELPSRPPHLCPFSCLGLLLTVREPTAMTSKSKSALENEMFQSNYKEQRNEIIFSLNCWITSEYSEAWSLMVEHGRKSAGFSTWFPHVRWFHSPSQQGQHMKYGKVSILVKPFVVLEFVISAS